MNDNRSPEVPAIPGIAVKIHLPKDPDRDYGKLRGLASVDLGGVFTVNGIRIYDTDKGMYVAMPSTKGQDGKYHDICHPTSKEMRQALDAAVLGAYERAVGQERPSVRNAIKTNARAVSSRPAPEQPKRAVSRGER